MPAPRGPGAPRDGEQGAPGGGRVVAVIGIDGSGKSTVVATIRAWLGQEIDVVPIYFGTGGGRPSLILWPFKLMVPLITLLLRTKPQGASHGKISNRPPGLLYSVLLMVWATVVAVEKLTSFGRSPEWSPAPLSSVRRAPSMASRRESPTPRWRIV